MLGVVSSSIALGEPFGWREVVALVLVVGAVALVLLQPQPSAASSDSAPGAAPSPTAATGRAE